MLIKGNIILNFPISQSSLPAGTAGMSYKPGRSMTNENNPIPALAIDRIVIFLEISNTIVASLLFAQIPHRHDFSTQIWKSMCRKNKPFYYFITTFSIEWLANIEVHLKDSIQVLVLRRWLKADKLQSYRCLGLPPMLFSSTNCRRCLQSSF